MSVPAITTNTLYGFKYFTGGHFNTFRGINVQDATFSVVSTSDPELRLQNISVSGTQNASDGTPISTVQCGVYYGTTNNSTVSSGTASCVLRVTRPGNIFRDFTLNIEFVPKTGAPSIIASPAAKACQTSGSFSLSASDLFSMNGRDGVLDFNATANNAVRTTRTQWTIWPTAVNNSATISTVTSNGLTSAHTSNSLNVTFSGTATTTTVSGSLSTTFGHGVLYEIPYSGRAPASLGLSGLPTGLTVLKLGFKYFIAGSPAAAGTFTCAASGSGNSGSVSITVATALPVIEDTASSITITRGMFLNYPVRLASTYSLPVSWAVTGGTLPTGITLNSSTGVLSGTTTAPVTPVAPAIPPPPITISATGGGGTTTKTYNLIIKDFEYASCLHFNQVDENKVYDAADGAERLLFNDTKLIKLPDSYKNRNTTPPVSNTESIFFHNANSNNFYPFFIEIYENSLGELLFEQKDFLVEVFINLTDFPLNNYGAEYPIYTSGDDNFQAFKISIDRQKIYCVINNSTPIFYYHGFQLNEWHHIVVKRRNGELFLFIDGNKATSVEYTDEIYNQKKFILGADVREVYARRKNYLNYDQSHANGFQGHLKGFRILTGTALDYLEQEGIAFYPEDYLPNISGEVPSVRNHEAIVFTEGFGSSTTEDDIDSTNGGSNQVLVSGAGVASLNGWYTLVGYQQSRPLYRKNDSEATIGYNLGVWYISVLSTFSAGITYTVTSTSTTVPPSGWSSQSPQSNPAPGVSNSIERWRDVNIGKPDNAYKSAWVQFPLGDVPTMSANRICIEGWFRIRPGQNWSGLNVASSGAVLQHYGTPGSSAYNAPWDIWVDNNASLRIVDGSSNFRFDDIKVPYHRWFHIALTIPFGIGTTNQVAYLHIDGNFKQQINNWTMGGWTPGDNTKVLRLCGDASDSREYVDVYDYRLSFGITANRYSAFNNFSSHLNRLPTTPAADTYFLVTAESNGLVYPNFRYIWKKNIGGTTSQGNLIATDYQNIIQVGTNSWETNEGIRPGSSPIFNNTSSTTTTTAADVSAVCFKFITPRMVGGWGPNPAILDSSRHNRYNRKLFTNFPVLFSNEVTKFGKGALLCLNDNGVVTWPYNAASNQNLNSDFTLEFWYNCFSPSLLQDFNWSPPVTAWEQAMIDLGGSIKITSRPFFAGATTTSSDLYDDPLNKIQGYLVGVYIGNNNDYTTGVNGQAIGSAEYNSWNHFALVKAGEYYTAYHNGIPTATWRLTQILTPSSNFNVGGNLIDSKFLGLVDDFRLTKNPQVYNMTGTNGSFSLPTTQQPPYLVPEIQNYNIYVNAFQHFAVFPKIIKNYDQPGINFYFSDDIVDEEDDYSYYFENLGINSETGEIYGQLNTIAESRPYRARYHIDLPSGQTTSGILSFFSRSSFNLSQGPALPFTEEILTDKAVLYIPSTGRFLINARGKLYLYDPSTNRLEQKVYSAFGRNASGVLGINSSVLSIDDPQDYEWAASGSHVYIRVKRSDQIDFSTPNLLQSNLYSLAISGDFNSDLSNSSIKTITTFNGYSLGNINPNNPTTVYYTASGAVETVYSLSTNATNIISTVTTIEPHSRPFNIFTSCSSFKRSSHAFSGFNFTFGENTSDFRWFFGGFSSTNPRYIYELLAEQKEVNYLNNNYEYWHHLTPLFQTANPSYYTHLNSFGGTYFILFENKSFLNDSKNFSIFGPNIGDTDVEIKCTLPRKNPADSSSPYYRPLSLTVTKKEDTTLAPPAEKYILTILANEPLSENISILSTEFTTSVANIMKSINGPWVYSGEINMASNGTSTIAYIEKGLSGFAYVSDNNGGKWRAVSIAGGSASYYSMTYGNNLFMFVRWMGNDVPIIYTTSNFSNFQNKNFVSTGNDLPTGAFINNIAFGQGKWILTTSVPGFNYISTNNGDSWTRIANLNSQPHEFKNIKFVNNIWFLLKGPGSYPVGSYVCHASTDGSTWTEIHSYPSGTTSPQAQQPYYDVVYHNGHYIFYNQGGTPKRTTNIWSTADWHMLAFQASDNTVISPTQMISFGQELLAFQIAPWPQNFATATLNYFVSLNNGASWTKMQSQRAVNTPIGGAILGLNSDTVITIQIVRGTANIYQRRTYINPSSVLPITHVRDLPLSGVDSSFNAAYPNTPTKGFCGLSPVPINDYEVFIFTNERGPQILKYIPGGKNTISSISANYFKNKNFNGDKFLIYDSTAFPKNIVFSSTQDSPVHTTGKFKKGLLLQQHKLTINGTASNTSIDIPNREYYISDIFYNQPFSFEAWFYIDSSVSPWGGQLFHVDQGDGTINHYTIELKLNYPGTLTLRVMIDQGWVVGDWNASVTIFDEPYFTSNVDKKWTHVAFARTSTGHFNVYINGVKPYTGDLTHSSLSGIYSAPLDISVCDDLKAKVSDIQITKGESIWTKPGTQQSSGYTADMLTPAFAGPLKGSFLLHNRNEVFSTAPITRYFYPTGDPFDENWRFVVDPLDGDSPQQYQQSDVLAQAITTISTYTSDFKKTRFNFKLVDAPPGYTGITTYFNPFILIDGSSGTGGSLPQNTIYFPFNEAVGVSTFTFGGMSLTQTTSTPFYSDPQPNLAIGTVGGWNGVHFNNGFVKHLVLSNQKNILSFGTDNFTVSFWAYATQYATYARFLSAQLTQGWGVELGGYPGTIKFGSYLLGELQVQDTLPLNQWVHIAFTRTNGIFRAFVNGQQRNILVSGSGIVANVNDNSNYLDLSGATNKNLTIGAFDGFPFSGYVRDLFISKGTSLYQTNFTPPPSAIADGLWVGNQSVPASPTAVTSIVRTYPKANLFNFPVILANTTHLHIIGHDSSGRYYDDFRFIRTGDITGKIVGHADNAFVGTVPQLRIGYKNYNYITQTSNPDIRGAQKGTPTTSNSGTLELNLNFTLNIDAPQLGSFEYSLGEFIEIYADMEGEVCDWGLELYAYDLPNGMDWEGITGECGNPTSLRIYGTPTAPGNFEITLVAVDLDGQEISRAFELFVDPGFSIGEISPVTANQNQQFSIAVPLVLTNLNLTLTASLSGFPAGTFTYNASTRQISGSSTVFGNFNPTITFTAPGGIALSETFSLTIVEFFQVITPQNTTLAKGAPMTPIVFRYIGEATQVDTITADTLPPGLDLVNEGDRQYIEGTPTEVNPWNGTTVTITVTTFSGLVRTVSFTITVTVKITLDVTNSALTYLLGTTLSSLVLETSGPTPCTKVSIPNLADLPDGLTYNETTRTISGTFLEMTENDYYGARVTVRLWNGDDYISDGFYFKILLGLTVEEIDNKTYNLGTDITPIPILISGNFNWTDISVTGLEDSGLYWDDPSGDQPVILGVAESSGIHQVVIRVYVYSSYVEQTFRITIVDAIDFTMPVNPVFPKFITITPLVISISGNITSLLFANLPPGLVFNSTNTSIQGTPTQVGTYNVTATAYNTSGIVLTKSEEFTVVEGTQDFYVVPNQSFVAQGRWMPGLMAAVNDPSILTGWVPPANSGNFRLPTGITQDPVTGIIRGLATEQGQGQFYLTAQVGEDFEYSALANWIVIFRKIQLSDITINVVRGRSASVQLTYTQDVPTRWVLNSPLPAGLSMTTAVTMDMNTGTISGGLITGITNVPNGVYTVIITAEHEIVPAFSTTKTYTINVGLNFIEIPSFLDLTAEVNLPFSVDIPLEGEIPATWEISSGNAGPFSITPLGEIVGTPLVTGSFSFNVLARLQNIVSNECEITIDVFSDDDGGGGGTAAPNLSNAIIRANLNTPFTFNLINAGGAIDDYEFSVNLPQGVSVVQSANGFTISGTITTSGVYNFDLIASNGTGTDTSSITIIVSDGRPIIPDNQSFSFVKSTTLPGTDKLNVLGETPTSISFSTLPSGIVFNPAAYTFTGTAPATTGETSHNVSASNLSGSTGNVPVKFIIKDEPITITPNQIFDLTEGTGSFGRNIATTGGTPTGGTLEFAPAGVQLFFNPARLSGTTPPAGNYNIRVTLTNFGNTSSAFVALVVSAEIPVITPNQTFTGTASNDAEFTVAFTGGTPITWGLPIPTQLPPGLTFSLSIGRFTGKPTTAGTFIVGIFAESSKGRSPTVNVTITITQGVIKPEIPSGQKFNLVTGQQVSNLFVQTTGGTATSWTATGLPQGLAIATTTGQISGTLNAAATTTSSNITASNSAGSSTGAVEFIITQPVTIPQITAGQTFTFTLNTTITTNATILFTGSGVTLTSQDLPSGVSMDGNTGRLQGRPLTAGVFNAIITARNSAGTDTETVSITVTSPTTQLPVLEQNLSPIQLIRNVNMTPYNFVNSGGIATAWAASNLPQGLSVNFNSGTISGRPSAVENKTVTVTASNSAGSATTTLAINVVSSVIPPVINNQTINAFRGAHFSFQLEATGTITNWLVDNIPNNSLPSGTSLSAIVGTISGIPSATGTFTTIIRVENESGSDTAEITIIVASSTLIPVITPNQTFIGRKGVNFNYTIGFLNSGGTPINWRLATAQTLLHPGITLDGRNGYLSGIPTTAGNTSAQLIASNSAGDSAPATINFQITESVNAPNIAQGQIFRATLNSPFSRNITFSGNVTEWRIVSGELPAGLILNGSTGALSGTPTVYSGSRTIRIFAGNQDGSDEENITVAVDEPAIVVSPGQSFNGYALDPFTATVRTQGNPISWQLTNLPTSLQLTISNTGVISGTPGIAGEYTGVVTATGVSGISGSASIKINILSKVPVITPNQVINLSTANFITYSIAFSSAGGTPPTQWAALTPLPQGLTLNTLRGTISGTPTQATSAGGVDCEIKVENSYGASSEKIKIIVAAITSLLKINPEQTVIVAAGTPFEFTPTYVGVPTGWYILNIPAGLSIDATTGKISGTISAPGTYRVCVYCENNRFDASAFINIKVN
jgi:hypothetical protein